MKYRNGEISLKTGLLAGATRIFSAFTKTTMSACRNYNLKVQEIKFET
jgi:hypothetical protein